MTVSFEPIRDDFGAIVHGVDLAAPLAGTDFEAIPGAFIRHGLLIFRGQDLEPEHEIAFARRFNKIRIYVGNDDTKLPGHPEINVLSNVVENGRPIGFQNKVGHEWHTDGTGWPYPAVATVLYCVEAPETGGETLYASGRRAWYELDDARKHRFEGLEVVYSFQSLYAKLHAAAGSGKILSEDERQRSPDVTHPLVRTHAVTGRKALWFTEAEMARFKGLGDAESRALADEIVAIISKPAYVYTHKWRPGDLVVWDNRQMHHSTTPYTYAGQRRIMHRVSGEGDEASV